jgi:hypothetical protein
MAGFRTSLPFDDQPGIALGQPGVVSCHQCLGSNRSICPKSGLRAGACYSDRCYYISDYLPRATHPFDLRLAAVWGERPESSRSRLAREHREALLLI